MRHTTRTQRAAAAFAALALVATACGGDADTDDGATTDASDDAGEDTADDGGEGAVGEVPDAPDDGVTADAIRIGWMGDVTGPTASAQAINLRGIEAYFEKVNAEGGVLGRDLELVVKDDEYGAEAGVANFQSLVNDDRVLAINQVGGAHIQEAVAADAERMGVPLVSVAQTIDSGLESEYITNTIAHYGDQADVAVARMIERVGSPEDLNVAVIQLEVPSGDEWNAYIQQEVEEVGGTYLGRQTINPAAADAGALVTNLQQMVEQDGLNYIALHAAPAQALLVVNSLGSAGIQIPLIGIQGIASLNVFQEGNAEQLEVTEGIHSFLTYADDSEGSEEISEFIEGEGSAYAADAAHINFTHGWVGGMIIHQAIERAAESGELTRASFQEGLQGPYDVKGLTCDIDWSGEANANACAAPFASDDGENMQIVGSFEQWAEHIDAEYGIGG